MAGWSWPDAILYVVDLHMAIYQLMSHDQNILIDWVDVADVLQTFYNVNTVSELFIHKCLKRHIFKFTRININKQITSFLNIWFYLFSSSFTSIYNLNRYLRLYWLCYTQVHNVCLISDCRNNQYLRALICIGVHFMI